MSATQFVGYQFVGELLIVCLYAVLCSADDKGARQKAPYFTSAHEVRETVLRASCKGDREANGDGLKAASHRPLILYYPQGITECFAKTYVSSGSTW